MKTAKQNRKEEQPDHNGFHACVQQTSVSLPQLAHCALACLLRRLNVHLSEFSRKTQSHVLRAEQKFLSLLPLQCSPTDCLNDCCKHKNDGFETQYYRGVVLISPTWFRSQYASPTAPMRARAHLCNDESKHIQQQHFSATRRNASDSTHSMKTMTRANTLPTFGRPRSDHTTRKHASAGVRVDTFHCTPHATIDCARHGFRHVPDLFCLW